jgi:hypothetical protein
MMNKFSSQISTDTANIAVETTVEIAGCAPSTYPIRDQVVNLFNEVYPSHVKATRADGLAGPNEIIQVLLDGLSWAAIVKGLVGAFGVGIATKAGQDTWGMLTKKFGKKDSKVPEWSEDQVRRLVAILHEAMKENSVTFGSKIPELSWADRHPGIVLSSADPAEIVRIASVLALNVEEFRSQAAAQIGQARTLPAHQNSDCTPRLVIEEDGTLSGTFYVTDPQTGQVREVEISSRTPSSRTE